MWKAVNLTAEIWLVGVNWITQKKLHGCKENMPTPRRVNHVCEPDTAKQRRQQCHQHGRDLEAAWHLRAVWQIMAFHLHSAYVFQEALGRAPNPSHDFLDRLSCHSNAASKIKINKNHFPIYLLINIWANEETRTKLMMKAPRLVGGIIHFSLCLSNPFNTFWVLVSLMPVWSVW